MKKSVLYILFLFLNNLIFCQETNYIEIGVERFLLDTTCGNTGIHRSELEKNRKGIIPVPPFLDDLNILSPHGHLIKALNQQQVDSIEYDFEMGSIKIDDLDNISFRINLFNEDCYTDYFRICFIGMEEVKRYITFTTSDFEYLSKQVDDLEYIIIDKIEYDSPKCKKEIIWNSFLWRII